MEIEPEPIKKEYWCEPEQPQYKLSVINKDGAVCTVIGPASVDHKLTCDLPEDMRERLFEQLYLMLVGDLQVQDMRVTKTFVSLWDRKWRVGSTVFQILLGLSKRPSSLVSISNIEENPLLDPLEALIQ